MSFIDYLAALPAVKLDRLYESNWTCQAVMRSLPPLAKQYVLRLLQVEAALPAKSFQDWILPGAESKHKAAINRLEHLRVFLRAKERGGKQETTYHLNSNFQVELRKCLSGKLNYSRGRPPGVLNLRQPTDAELEEYAAKQWEAVLLQLVNTGNGQKPHLSPAITEAFVQAGLLSRSENTGEPARITEQGFQYLLLDTNAQLWRIVKEYVTASEIRGVDSAQLVSFLMELGFHEAGQPYSVEALSTLQKGIIDELASLGLLYIQKAGGQRWYFPTRLAANLSASLSESATWERAEGFVMVETNFRLYAYTSSPLQVALLKLFNKLEYQLPNLVVGAITRESIGQALASGISAEQIILYLQQHAHPHVRLRTPVVPETVADQIRLWEFDRNRVRQNVSVLYEDFPKKEHYEAVVKRARELGVLLFDDDKSRRLIVTAAAHDTMKTYIRALKNT